MLAKHKVAFRKLVKFVFVIFIIFIALCVSLAYYGSIVARDYNNAARKALLEEYSSVEGTLIPEVETRLLGGDFHSAISKLKKYEPVGGKVIALLDKARGMQQASEIQQSEKSSQEKVLAIPKTIITTSTITTTTTTSVPVSVWSYSSNVDQMYNKTNKYAEVDSSTLLNFDFPYSGAQRATLIIRNHHKHGKDVMLKVEKGQFLCSFSGCNVVVKADNGSPTTFSAGQATSGNSNVLFIQGYQSFINLIKGKKKLLIQAEFYQEPSTLIEFEVYGLDLAKLN